MQLRGCCTRCTKAWSWSTAPWVDWWVEFKKLQLLCWPGWGQLPLPNMLAAFQLRCCCGAELVGAWWPVACGRIATSMPSCPPLEVSQRVPD